VYGQAIRNLNDGVSLLNVADSSLSELGGIIQRQIELASQASNGSYSTAQRASLTAEALALRDEYNRIVRSTAFNGRMILQAEGGQTAVQAGFGTESIYNLNVLDPSTAQQLSYQGLGTYTSKVSSASVGGIYNSDVGDFNEDGRTDLFSVEQMSDGTLYYQVMLADSQGRLQAWDSGYITSPGSSGWTYEVDEFAFSLGDGNGDGHLDVSLYYGLNGYTGGSSTSYEFAEKVFYGDGDGFLSEGGPSASFVGATPGLIDFNGDGVADTITAGSGSYTTQIQDTRAFELLDQSAFSLATRNAALSALTMLQSSLSNITSKRGAIGAMQSRLEIGLNNLASQREGYQRAASTLTDTDIAQESSQVVRLTILQQTVAAILAQANLGPRLALSLLQR
jgi:flagellin